MDVQKAFKSFLYTWMRIQLECLLRMTAVANCAQCLRGETSSDNSHSCFRIKIKEVKYERIHIIHSVTTAEDSLLNSITCHQFLSDLLNTIYIHLRKKSYSHGQIPQYLYPENVIETACSNEASTWIFNQMWTNYPEPVMVSLTRYTGPSLTVPVAVACNSQVQPTTASTSQGSPMPSVTTTDNRQLSPDRSDPIDIDNDN